MLIYDLEAATRDALWKKVFLEISQNSQENTCASLFLNKVVGPALQLYLKRDPSTGVFLWILQIF